MMARILVVDDEESIRSLLQISLSEGDYEVGLAEDAGEAMGMLAAEDYDVVLTDIILPGMSGVSLLKSIKEASPHVQVILMTGRPTVETASEAVRAGAFDYLAKPIHKEQLFRAVANAVNVKTLDEERRHLAEENRRYRENLERLVEERTTALRESEEHFRELLERAGDAIFLMNSDGRFVLVNEQACKSLGYSREELLGLRAWDVDVGWSVDVLKGLWQGLRSGPPETHEGRQRRKDGSTFPAEARIGAFRWKDDEFALILSRDITERKRREKERERLLRNTGERVKELQCLYGVAVSIRTRESLEEIFGDVVGLIPLGWQYPEFTRGRVHFDGRDYDSEPFEETPWRQASDIVVDGVARGVLEVFYLEERPDLDEGPFLKEERDLIDGVARTLSEAIEHRQAEETAQKRQLQLTQADKMASLGILVSGMAHEINNPNHLIMANAQQISKAWAGAIPILDEFYEENGDFMLGGLKYSEMREWLVSLCSGILEGSQSIKTIVEELRDYARQGPEGVTERVNLNEVAEAAQRLLRNPIAKSTERFQTSLDEEIPAVEGSAQRLTQVAVNLIQNACQALPGKEKGVSLSTGYDADVREVYLVVKDEGTGISEDSMKHLTDPFFTTKRDSGGTGLGLSISSTIVEEHGGRLEFSPTHGEGTTVTVRLPAAILEE